jgi:hypothetical protein
MSCAVVVIAVLAVMVGNLESDRGAAATSQWPEPIVDRSPLPKGTVARISGVVNYRVGLPNGAGTMRFESEGRTVDAVIKGNRFVVELPSGVWSQRSLDGRICDAPFVVGGSGPNYYPFVQYEGRFAGCTPIGGA